jgi:hypothetical protein
MTRLGRDDVTSRRKRRFTPLRRSPRRIDARLTIRSTMLGDVLNSSTA